MGSAGGRSGRGSGGGASKDEVIAYVLVAVLLVLAAGGAWASLQIAALVEDTDKSQGEADKPASHPVELAHDVATGRTDWTMTTTVVALALAVVLTAVVVLLFVVLTGSSKTKKPRLSGLERQRERAPQWGGNRDQAVKDVTLAKGERVAYDRLSLGWLPGAGNRATNRASEVVVAAPVRSSVAVFAPTQSGKTSAFVVNRVLEWSGAMVATSAKADLVRLTMAQRSAQGPVWVFDPLQTLSAEAGGVGIETCHWSPLMGVRTYSDALKAASWIVSTSTVAGGDAEKQRFWDENAKRMLAPLLYAAAQDPVLESDPVSPQVSHERHVRQVGRWLRQGSQADAELEQILRAAGDRDARDGLAGLRSMHDQTRSNVASTALVVLDPFVHPRTHDALTPTGDPARDFDPARLLEQGGTLYVYAPEHEVKEFKTLFETLINTVVFEAQDRSAARGGLPIEPHHVLLALDEAANMASLRSLPELSSVGSGQGIVLMTIWQNLSQIEGIYGPTGSRTLLAGHNVKVYFGGIQDEPTLKYIDAMCGEFEHQRTSHTRDRDRRSTSTSTETRRLAPPDYVRKLPRLAVLVLIKDFKPLRLQLRPWYEDEATRALVDPAVAAEFDDALSTPAPAGRKARGKSRPASATVTQSTVKAGQRADAVASNSDVDEGTRKRSPWEMSGHE